MSSSTAGFHFENTYADSLEGFSVECQAAQFPSPKLVRLNRALATELGLDADALAREGAEIFSGKNIPAGANPIAQAYAGHRFGGFSPQLGDGRALLLGELVDSHGRRRDLQLKGSGPTPFSRGGDGKAALGPVLREYLVAEAMYALGIPTTRALGAVTTGEMVFREEALPGAVLARVAASHIRVGTFEFFAARGESGHVRRLADYTISRHYPNAADSEQPYTELLRNVATAQAELVAQWMLVGFIHGVMNTDNVTVSGETIDYGPCAFMDSYDPATVFSSIDRQGRYAYGNQPSITQWNLARFAEALLPLLADDPKQAEATAHDVLDGFVTTYQREWLSGMRRKLGLVHPEDGDLELAEKLLVVMKEQQADYTATFRALSGHARGDATAATAATALFGGDDALEGWAKGWRERLSREQVDVSELAGSMDEANPVYVPRNHLVEGALDAAVQHQDMGPFETLLGVLSAPFEEQENAQKYAQPAPADFGPYKTFCGT